MSEHLPTDSEQSAPKQPAMIEVPNWARPPRPRESASHAELVQALVDAGGDEIDPATGDLLFVNGAARVAEGFDAPTQKEFASMGKALRTELQTAESAEERFKLARRFIEEVLAAAGRGEVISKKNGTLSRTDLESRLEAMAFAVNAGDQSGYLAIPSNGELRQVFEGLMQDESSSQAVLDAILHPDLLERAGEPLREEVAEDMGETAVEAAEANPYEDFLNGNEHLDPNDTQQARVEEASEVQEARRLAQARRVSDINDAANKAAGRPEMN